MRHLQATAVHDSTSELCIKNEAVGRKGGEPLTVHRVQQETIRQFIQAADTKIMEEEETAKMKQ